MIYWNLYIIFQDNFASLSEISPLCRKGEGVIYRHNKLSLFLSTKDGGNMVQVEI